MLNRRERLLGIIMAAVLAGVALFQVIDKILLARLHTANEQLRNLQSEVATKEKRLQQALRLQVRLAEWQGTSLPPDAQTAQSLYGEFLFKLMQDCQLEERSVTAENVSPGKYFTRIPFTVTARCTLENLTAFLYRFHEPNLLHQVRHLLVRNAKGPDGKLLDVRIGVEGLALHSAPARNELIPAGQESHPRPPDPKLADFAIIGRTNIFEPFREPPKPVPPPPSQPVVDVAREIYLTGTTTVGDQQLAWLYDKRTDGKLPIEVGEELDIAGLQGRVASVTYSGILLEIDDKVWSLKLGRNLREMREVTASEATDIATGSAEDPP